MKSNQIKVLIKNFGKINPKIVKALIKVIIDDTEYEIYNLGQYIDYLKNEINRLKQIAFYENKLNKSTKDVDVKYYLAGIKQLLSSGETLENYKNVLEEYNQTYIDKNESINKLADEFKQIKALKV